MAKHNVQSPSFGTFYHKANPDAPSYTEVGRAIKTGNVIRLIEVMKQFPEMQTGQAGVLQVFRVEDGGVIESEQVLVVVVSAT